MRCVAVRIITVCLTLALCCGCKEESSSVQVLVDEVLAGAGDNAGELHSVLDRYSGGSRAAAEYAVAASWGRVSRSGAGMDSIEALYRLLPRNGSWGFDSVEVSRGRRYSALPLATAKDAATLTADYLCTNIDDALRLREGRSWNRNLPQELFCEMLLPYRVGDEPVSGWREAYREWLSDLDDTIAGCSGSVEAARIISGRIGPCPYNDALSTPHRRATDLLESPAGYCREDCDRTLYAMRSMGVPAATDMMLVSPENGSSHSWNVVWDNIDGSTRMFDNREYLPSRDSVHYDKRRRGKVYRQTFAPDLARLRRYRDAVNPPAVLMNPWLKDVTAEYFGENRAEVGVWRDLLPEGDGSVYLGVFAGQRFQPVDIGELKGDAVVFRDIEPELIYAPVSRGGNICGYPFLLRRDGSVHSFVPDEGRREGMTLTRKFPIRFHQRNRLNSAVGVHVQCAPTASGPWRGLEVIESAPEHNFRRIRTGGKVRERYLRLYKPEGVPAQVMMLLACRDSLGLDRMPLSIVGDSTTRARYRRILDYGYGFFLQPGAEDCIVRVESDEDINSIFYLPHHDDNFVVPAQEYELLYFSGRDGWKSAGRKMSDGFSICFEAPAGAVLWLRNLTKGREEQIFLWRDSRQLFNIDLHAYDLR